MFDLFRRFALVHFRVAALKFIQKMEKNYIVQSEILTISLQETKVIKNDLCPPSSKIHVGKSINIPVLLLCFLVNFHICVDLPHKGTCSHVSNGTWKTNVFCEFPFRWPGHCKYRTLLSLCRLIHHRTKYLLVKVSNKRFEQEK